MFRIVRKEELRPTVTLYEIEAPLVAKKAQPGQFIILRVDENGERIPLTVADYDRVRGSVTVIFQVVGASTEKLNRLGEGDCLHDFVGPLGRATHTDGLRKVAVVGGGVGCAIAFPVAKKLHALGCEVHAIVGFRTKDLVILEREFEENSTRLIRMSDDGSFGEKGLVTDALRALIESGEQYDEIITIGPLVMMKFVCALAKEYGIPMIVAVNQLDGDKANWEGTLESMKETFGNKPVVVQYPVTVGAGFDGFVDVLKMKYYRFEGDTGKRQDLEIPAELADEAEIKYQYSVS